MSNYNKKTGYDTAGFNKQGYNKSTGTRVNLIGQNQKEARISRKQEVKKEQEVEMAKVIAKLNAKKAKLNAKKAKYEKQKKHALLLGLPFLLDTNVWMNGETDFNTKKIFQFILEENRKVILPSVIYDEIMKKKEQGKKNHKSETSRKARSAIKKVRELQYLGLITMTEVSIQYDKKAYADTYIIEGFKQNKSDSILLSDDVDVVIRSSHFIQSNSSKGKAMLVSEFADNYC